MSSTFTLVANITADDLAASRGPEGRIRRGLTCAGARALARAYNAMFPDTRHYMLLGRTNATVYDGDPLLGHRCEVVARGIPSQEFANWIGNHDVEVFDEPEHPNRVGPARFEVNFRRPLPL